MHLQNSDLCLANYFLDAFDRKTYFKFGDGFWPINMHSLTLTCAYPDVDNQKSLFSSKPILLKTLNSTSSVFVKRNSKPG